MCLSVPKDLANHLTDIVHLYSVASLKSWEMFIPSFFGGQYHPPLSQEKSPKKIFKFPLGGASVYLLHFPSYKVAGSFSIQTTTFRHLETFRGRNR